MTNKYKASVKVLKNNVLAQCLANMTVILATMVAMVVLLIVLKVKYVKRNGKINYCLLWKYRFNKEEEITSTGSIIFQ